MAWDFSTEPEFEQERPGSPRTPPLPTTERRHLVVRGRVQGVYYRESCRREADRLGVAGWARNLPNGAVEVVIEGEPEAVENLVRWCRHGPPHALVSAVDVTREPPEHLTDFRVR